jgi:tetratricopeptide (TPR) repeat protein
MNYAQFLITASVIIFVGCEPAKPKAKATAFNPASTSSNSAASSPPANSLSAEQKQLFVDHVLAVANGQKQGDMIDPDIVFAKVADFTETPAAKRQSFINTAKQGYFTNTVASNLTAQVKAGGNFVFLRYSQRGNVYTAIFRLIRADTAFAYYEFALPAQESKTALLASDVYLYSNSQWLSQISADLMLQIGAVESPSLLNKLFRSSGLGSNDSKKLSRLIASAKAQNWQEVIATYNELPKEMKQSKVCLMFRFNAATNLQDPNEITSVINDLRKFCPNDPGIEILSLDYYTIRKEYGKAMSALDSLDRSVGGDAYIDVLRANIFLQANDLDQAIAVGRKAIEQEPTLVTAHDLLAQAAQAKGDYAMVSAEMRTLQSMGVVTPDSIESLPDFAPFVASSEFKAWKADSEASEPAKK